MKTAFFVFVLMFVSVSKAEVSDAFIEVLIQKESSGDDRAIGDTHLKQKAFGCLQIRQPVCIDVNRRFGTNHRAEDCLGNRALSIEIFKKYISIYGGENPTKEKVARVWNGGPTGHKRSTTLKYWSGVQKIMSKKGVSTSPFLFVYICYKGGG